MTPPPRTIATRLHAVFVLRTGEMRPQPVRGLHITTGLRAHNNAILAAADQMTWENKSWSACHEKIMSRTKTSRQAKNVWVHGT